MLSNKSDNVSPNILFSNAVDAILPPGQRQIFRNVLFGNRKYPAAEDPDLLKNFVARLSKDQMRIILNTSKVPKRLTTILRHAKVSERPSVRNNGFYERPWFSSFEMALLFEAGQRFFCLSFAGQVVKKYIATERLI